MDFLRSKLATCDLLDVIDVSIPQPSEVTSEMEEKINILARDLIINRLDRHYHNKVCDTENCKDIISKIVESKSIETDVTGANVRALRKHLMKDLTQLYESMKHAVLDVRWKKLKNNQPTIMQ